MLEFDGGEEQMALTSVTVGKQKKKKTKKKKEKRTPTPYPDQLNPLLSLFDLPRGKRKKEPKKKATSWQAEAEALRFDESTSSLNSQFQAAGINSYRSCLCT